MAIGGAGRIWLTPTRQITLRPGIRVAAQGGRAALRLHLPSDSDVKKRKRKKKAKKEKKENKEKKRKKKKKKGCSFRKESEGVEDEEDWH
jgi:hypothetical protein